MEVHKAAARILHEGITTTEVLAFMQQAHVKLGATLTGSGIVLFGEPTAYPHGVPYPQTLRPGDMVLIDVGVEIEGDRSDLTRSYVFGEPTMRQRQIWELEKSAQLAAFAAAQPGAPCEAVDAAARDVIADAGFGTGSPRLGCRIAPAMASGSMCTKRLIWCRATARRSLPACAFRSSR